MEIIDLDIANEIRNGNENKVFERLYSRVFPKVRRYIISNSGNEEDAHDTFQDSIMAMIEQIRCNNINEKQNVKSYLFTIAKNKWINLAKKKKLDTTTINEGLDYLHENEQPEVIKNEKKDALNILMSKLGDDCKQLLYDLYYFEMSSKEVMKKYELVSLNAVKKRVYRCRNKIKEMTKKNPGLISFLKFE